MIKIFHHVGAYSIFIIYLHEMCISGMLPHVYSDIPYGIYTIEVRAMSDTATVAIEQKGKVSCVHFYATHVAIIVCSSVG